VKFVACGSVNWNWPELAGESIAKPIIVLVLGFSPNSIRSLEPVANRFFTR
jgi:hypothetical protein